MKIIRGTIVIVKKDDTILLMHNKRGINRDKWTGLGGSLHPGNDLQTSAQRYVELQSSLKVESLEKLGKIEVKFAGVQELAQYNIFVTESFSGNLRQRGERYRLDWHPLESIPYKEMWPDVVYWLPHILSGKKIRAYFIYENENIIYCDMSTDVVFGSKAA